MSWGKSKKHLEENKLADILLLIGAYLNYPKKKNDIDFKQFYFNRKDILKYKYQSDANRMINKALAWKGIDIFNRTSRKFYSRDARRGVKVSGKIGDYLICVLDYVFKNETLYQIMLEEIFHVCPFYNKESRGDDFYEDCLNSLLGFQYAKLSTVVNEPYEGHMSNRIKKAHKSWKRMFEYDNLGTFKMNCRNYK